MTIQKNVSLKPYNTFRIDVNAKYFAEVKSDAELKEVLSNSEVKNEPKLVLGGGSNVLLTKDFDGLVIKLSSEGIEKITEDANYVWLKVQAGHNWHDFVTYCVEQGLYGVENMALIPGSVGAAAVQNIAAYGGNLIDVFDSLEAINIKTQEIKKFTKEECEFTYRSSLFKVEKGKDWIVISVTLKLGKTGNIEHNYHERYLSLDGALKEIAKEPYNLKDIYNAVIHLRNIKLPKIEDYGTAGSIFKNPIVSRAKFEELAKKISELQHYPVENLKYDVKEWAKLDSGVEYVKVPAGRILDELGWKNKWLGNVGTFERHALCVITNGKATGTEVLDFVNKMKADVKNAYDVDLESEIVIV